VLGEQHPDTLTRQQAVEDFKNEVESQRCGDVDCGERAVASEVDNIESQISVEVGEKQPAMSDEAVVGLGSSTDVGKGESRVRVRKGQCGCESYLGSRTYG
jgi:hypothetical protein